MMVKTNDGKWVSFEIKTTKRKRLSYLDNKANKPNQRSGADKFTKNRLNRAVNDWKSMPPGTKEKAKEILKDLKDNNQLGTNGVKGFVIQIMGAGTKDSDTEIRKWVKGSSKGDKL